MPALPAPRTDSWTTRATLLATSMCAPLVSSTVSPALRDMGVAFAHVPNSEVLVRLVLTVPALFIVLGSPLAGWVVDRYGRKPLLVACMGVFAFAGSAAFLAQSLWAILAGRAVLGLAFAGLITSVTTLITDYYTGSERARLLGLQAAVMGVGGTIFLTVSGVLAESGWRWPFLIYLLSLVLLPFVILVLREPAREIHQPAAGDSGSGSVQDGAVEPVGWPIGFMAFVYGTIVLLQIAFYLVPVEFSFYLNDLLGVGGSRAGAAVALMTLSFAGGSLLFRMLRDRYSSAPVVALGGALVALGYVAIGRASGWVLIIVGLILSGVGLGFSVPNLNAWLADSVPDAIRGRAMGMFTTAIFLGQFFSPLVTRPLSTAASLSTTFSVVGIFVGVLSVAGAVVAWRIRNGSGERTHGRTEQK